MYLLMPGEVEFFFSSLQLEPDTDFDDDKELLTTYGCSRYTSSLSDFAIIFFRHCEERSDVAIHLAELTHGLLRYARNDEG